MTSPISGTQRSVSMVGEHASGEAIQIWTITTGGRVNTGRIGGIELSNRGTGYVAPPTVHFFGSGFGRKLQPRLLRIQQIHAMVK